MTQDKIIEKHINKWISQGRTEEQIHGVKNFMTGQGAIMLKDLQSYWKKKVEELERQCQCGYGICMPADDLLKEV